MKKICFFFFLLFSLQSFSQKVVLKNNLEMCIRDSYLVVKQSALRTGCYFCSRTMQN